MSLTQHKEKKVGNINAHLPPSRELAVRRLAESEGISASEYVNRIIISHLEEKHRQLTILKSALEGDGSMSSDSSA